MISKFKFDVKDKDGEIIPIAKVIHRLKGNLDNKEREIKEKDTIINIIKHNYKKSGEEKEDSDDL